MTNYVTFYLHLADYIGPLVPLYDQFFLEWGIVLKITSQE